MLGSLPTQQPQNPGTLGPHHLQRQRDLLWVPGRVWCLRLPFVVTECPSPGRASQAPGRTLGRLVGSGWPRPAAEKQFSERPIDGGTALLPAHTADPGRTRARRWAGMCAGPRKGLPLFTQSSGGGRYGFGLVPLNVWLLWPPSRATGKSLHTDRVQPRLGFLHCPLNPQGYLLFQSRAKQEQNHRPWLILWGKDRGRRDRDGYDLWLYSLCLPARPSSTTHLLGYLWISYSTSLTFPISKQRTLKITAGLIYHSFNGSPEPTSMD